MLFQSGWLFQIFTWKIMELGCVFVCLFFRKVPGTQDIHHWSVPTIPSTSLELRLANSAGLSVQRTWAARSDAARSSYEFFRGQKIQRPKKTRLGVFVEVKSWWISCWIHGCRYYPHPRRNTTKKTWCHPFPENAQTL